MAMMRIAVRVAPVIIATTMIVTSVVIVAIAPVIRVSKPEGHYWRINHHCGRIIGGRWRIRIRRRWINRRRIRWRRLNRDVGCANYNVR
jgi:hypothetical protein